MTKRLVILLILLLPFTVIYGQRDTTDYSKKKKFDALEERSKVKYRTIPLPSYDPTTKWGIALLLMANYYPTKLDTLSPPSMTGVMGFATTNGSWGTGILQNLNIKQDKWRLTGRLFYMKINQVLELGDLGNANSTRNMAIASLTAKRRIFSNLFLGLGYTFRSIEYEGKDEQSQAILDLAGYNQKARNHGLEYLFSFDTRDNIFYTYRGYYIAYNLGQNFNNSSTESQDDFLENEIDLRYFVPVNGNTDHILAAHFYGRILSGNPTNENYSFYGRSGRHIQRGYEAGSFIDKNMISAEVEYRRETPLLKRKLGFITFLSVGKVYGDFNSFSDAEWLPAGGVGVRYRFLEYERMNFKTDIAYGKDGWAVYFGINEAF